MGNPFLLPQAKLQQSNWLLRDGGPTRTYRSDSHRLLLCRADDRSARKTIVNTQGGIELDVLIGHPEHYLLFVATQVARAAGLKNPSMAIQGFQHNRSGAKLRIADLPDLSDLLRVRALPAVASTWLFDEPRVYAMLLRGNAQQSEPFRR